jgi:hypothetical protein
MSSDNYARLLRAEILMQWTLLDLEAVESSNGDRAKIITMLTHRYGFSDSRAAREVERVYAEFSEKMRRAA